MAASLLHELVMLQRTLNHHDRYAATGFTRPYPGEKTVSAPSGFVQKRTHPNSDIDD